MRSDYSRRLRIVSAILVVVVVPGCRQRAVSGVPSLSASGQQASEGKLSAVDENLVAAVTSGVLQGVKSSIARGANVNCRLDSPGGHTLLHLAVRNGNLPVVMCLIDSGAKLNDSGGHANALLEAAASGNYADVIDVLLAHGAKVDTTPAACASLLNKVLEHDLVPLLKQMLAQGMDVNMNLMGTTPLIDAASEHNAWSVRCLLEHGARVNDADVIGMTALMFAGLRDDRKMAQLLLDSGANPNAVDKAGRNVIDYVQNPLMIRLLLRHGAVPTPKNDLLGVPFPGSLRAEAEAGHLARVRKLLAIGADVNDGEKISGLAATSLTLAAINGNVDVVRLLLSNGAKVNETVKDSFRDYPGVQEYRRSPALLEAIKGRKLSIVRLLQRHGAVNDTGFVPAEGSLRAAAEIGNIVRVKALIARGADVNEGENEETRLTGTPLTLAARNGHIEVMRLLLDRGANVNDSISSYRKSPALIEALEAQDSDMVRLLQKHGAANDPIPDAVPRNNNGHYGAG